jgi:hypothetical protein
MFFSSIRPQLIPDSPPVGRPRRRARTHLSADAVESSFAKLAEDGVLAVENHSLD